MRMLVLGIMIRNILMRKCLLEYAIKAIQEYNAMNVLKDMAKFLKSIVILAIMANII